MTSTDPTPPTRFTCRLTRWLLAASMICTWGLGCGDEASRVDPDGSGMADGATLDGAAIPDGAAVGDAGPGDDAGPGSDAVVDDGLHPVLSNFRVEDAQPDRVYFDSSESITATTTTGFTVSGKTLTGVSIHAGSSTDHYFTVATDFTFWDNNTIRYEGGSDVEDLQGNELFGFTLRYIDNMIPEPPASTSRYVTVTGAGGHDGTSEANAWTLTEAGALAEAGQTVWIKAGDYGDTPLVISQEGTATAPLKLIGYQTSPGDSPTLPRNQDTVFDASVMPYIHSTSTSGSGIDFDGKRFIVVKNLQVEGFSDPLTADGNVSDCLVENVYVRGGSHNGFHFFAYDTRRLRVKGCYSANCAGAGIRVAGDHNLIDDMVVTSRGTPDMDYLISLYGGTIGTGNIVRNSAVIRDPIDTHTGHGISVKAGGRPLEHTLIENCTIHEVAQAVELRHHQTRFTIVRNVIATGNRDSASNLVTFRDGTNFNTVEDCLADGVYSGVLFTMNAGEDLGIQEGGHHNRVVNTVFRNCKYNIVMNGWNGTPLESTDNEFLNCTFYGSNYMFALPIDFGDTNHFTNCSFVDVSAAVFNTGTPTTSYTYCNFWNSWDIPSGAGNLSVDPQFVDPAGGDFHLQSSSALCGSGVDLAEVRYDRDGVERPPGSYSIGAYECAP
jgi:hypothetical protein